MTNEKAVNHEHGLLFMFPLLPPFCYYKEKQNLLLQLWYNIHAIRINSLGYFREKHSVELRLNPEFSSSGDIQHTYIHLCRPRWSQGNVLVSRSKVRGFKPGWGWLMFSGRKNPPGGNLSWGYRVWDFRLYRVWDFRLVKEPQVWKNRPLSKIYSAYLRPSNA